jgi:hypothetical protein
MPDIWEDLAAINELAAGRDSIRLLAFGRARCEDLAGGAVAASLAAIDAAEYVAGLADGAQAAASKAKALAAPAVYFEYELDNGWSSNFFICNAYSSAGSDWASDWQDRVQGPSMLKFAAEYDSEFATDAVSQGRTVMLVARTLAALIEATESWPEPLVLAVAYHDQDQVTTIWPSSR